MGVKARCRARVDAPRLSPPSQPFPATASAEGAQLNVPPSPAREKENKREMHCEKSPKCYAQQLPRQFGGVGTHYTA